MSLGSNSGPVAVRCVVPLLLVLNTVRAQEQSRDTLHPIQGAAVSGQIESIAKDGTITLTTEAGKTTRELAELRHIDLAVPAGGPPVPRQGFILLRSGVQIPAAMRPEDCVARKVSFRSPLIEGQATVGLSHIGAIRFAKLPADNDGGFAKYAAEPKDDKDLIYFKTTDKIVQRSVTIEGFVDGRVHYQVRDRTLARDIGDLYGIVMARASGFAPDPLERPRGVLAMEGGTTLRGRIENLDAKHCSLTLAEGATLEVLRFRMRRITVESDRLVFLTDLDPKVEQTAAFRTKKPWLKNRSPLGEGIQLGGVNPRSTQNGLVLVPKTRLTYDIDGKFDFFVATIGIDNRSTGPAHAIFRVLDGDKVLYESKPLTKESEPVPLKVSVTAVKRLTIEADFGKNFDFGDHCVFADARVIKQGS